MNSKELFEVASKNLGERCYLNVPFEKKDAVKAKGARWDADAKKWYVEDWLGIEGFNIPAAWTAEGAPEAFASLAFYIEKFLSFHKIEVAQFRAFLNSALSESELAAFFQNVTSTKTLSSEVTTLEELCEQIAKVTIGKAEPLDTPESTPEWMEQYAILEKEFDITAQSQDGRRVQLKLKDGVGARIVDGAESILTAEKALSIKAQIDAKVLSGEFTVVD
jgi:hypothetical protein